MRGVCAAKQLHILVQMVCRQQIILAESLKSLGVEMRRFKTGTPARMDKRSIDFSKMEEQFGDERIVPFSFSTDPESVQKPRYPAGLLIPMSRPMRLSAVIWTDLLYMPVL